MSTIVHSLGRLFTWEGRTFFLMGNGIDEEERIWCADLATGEYARPCFADLIRLPQSQQPSFDAAVGIASRWAKEGIVHSMWWLADLNEGVNYERSIWYYMAALRRDNTYRWLWTRILANAASAIMCEGVPAPDTRVLQQIPEFCGGAYWGDWKEAILEAENSDSGGWGYLMRSNSQNQTGGSRLVGRSDYEC